MDELEDIRDIAIHNWRELREQIEANRPLSLEMLFLMVDMCRLAGLTVGETQAVVGVFGYDIYESWMMDAAAEEGEAYE